MKQVLITGASRGIGAAAALAFAREGYRVWIHYRSRLDAARELAARITSEGAPEPVLAGFDLAQRSEAEAATRSLLAAHGVPDALVLNAGIAPSALFGFTSGQTWDETLEVNLGGLHSVGRPVLNGMLARRSGRVVLLSSVAAQKGNRGQVAYAASKGALHAAAKSLALELGSRGITVNVVAPGLIETEMLAGTAVAPVLTQVPAGRVGTPTEVAHVIRYLCSDEAGYVTGQVVAVNGGLWMG